MWMNLFLIAGGLAAMLSVAAFAVQPAESDRSIQQHDFVG